MSEKKLGPLVVIVFGVLLTTLPVQNVFGQAAAQPPAKSASSVPSSTATQTPKPRPPTRKDVAELKAAMDWPGSTLSSVAIVGHYAEAGFFSGNIGDSMIASNESGKWEKIDDAGAGSFNAEGIVEELPEIPVPVAEALAAQAALSQVYWSENAQEAATQDKNTVAYYEYWDQGDEAARQGDFDAVIAAWTKAAALDLGDLVSCRDQVERVRLQAAKDAKARMEQLHLTKAEAAEWYEQQNMKLWKQIPCDKP